MLKTYFLVAYRNFVRNKIFSLINVLGLSIGISASLVIFLIVHYDFSFDKFQHDRDRLYRVVTEIKVPGNIFHVSGIPSPLPIAAKKEISSIEDVIGFHQFDGDGKVTIAKKNNEKPLVIKSQSGIVLVDKSYFKLIPYQWLAGSMQTALKEPLKVVLTAERAKTYFPTISYTDMIGKQIIYDDTIVTTVTGIVQDLSSNTDFIFKEFISQSTISETAGLKGNYSWDSWSSINGGSQMIVKLTSGVSSKNIESQIQLLENKYNKVDNNNLRIFHLQPFADIHFNPLYSTFGDHTAHKPTLYGLLIVAAFLLILACINFINLTTAQSSQRAKEIGVRKTLGSTGKQLIFQFLTETFLLTFISLIISILITPLLLKIFADFIPADLHFDILHQPYLIGFAILLTFVISLLAGLYPAFILSGFNPVLVLKNHSYTGISSSRKALLRKGLTLSQFLIAQIFTMATMIAVKQIHFMMNKDLGFKKDAIINVYTPFWNSAGKPDNKRMVLLNEIKRIPGVELASLGSGAPAENGWSSDEFKYRDGKKEVVTEVNLKYGDTNYLKLYHLKLLSGRNIKASDTTNEYVINETYMHILGFQNPDEILNKQINYHPIVGVMADFNSESLHSPVKPIAFSSEIGNSWELHIALKQGDAQGNSWKAAIAGINKAYNGIFPESDFSYEFLDESIARFYKTEQNVSGLLKWATGLTIFISCMGLLGLVMFTTNQRTKEIGVRKVLGASVGQIVSILSKDFLRLVLIASVIAVPLTWWAMNKWLENFAFKTAVNWWVFALSALFMMIVALLTLSIQTIRAANANPVESLRTE